MLFHSFLSPYPIAGTRLDPQSGNTILVEYPAFVNMKENKVGFDYRAVPYIEDVLVLNIGSFFACSPMPVVMQESYKRYVESIKAVSEK